MNTQQMPVRTFLNGRARTKGSLDVKMVRVKGGGLKAVQQDTEQSKAWKQSMVRQLREQLGITVGRVAGKVARTDAEPYPGDVEVHAFFRFERMRSVAEQTAGEVWASHDIEWPTDTDTGDEDKLRRNLLDALTQSGVLADPAVMIGHDALCIDFHCSGCLLDG